jgi:stearoyl-CoA desaturase (Delta-9 desaturase)
MTMDVTPPAPVRANTLYSKLGVIPFIIAHFMPFLAYFTGVTNTAVWFFLISFFVRQWAVTAGYHRYFAHKAYETSRVFQFILAFLAQATAQKGALWWAAHHRAHHQYSDREGDLHSPVRDGFLYSHMGWLFADTEETDWDRIKDFAKFPELVWLDRYWWLPPFLTGVLAFVVGGWSTLWFGFFGSTVLMWHNTFTINSLAHVWGSRRFKTKDTSRNNPILAITTLGEGWHNNHHYYSASARNGFYWWEIDVTYYVLRILSVFGIVWNLRPVPKRVLEEGRRPIVESSEASDDSVPAAVATEAV